MQSAQLVTLLQDQAPHVLALFVRIIDHIAGWVVDIPNRQGKAQRAPARFL
jgi:hypothetical protein